MTASCHPWTAAELLPCDVDGVDPDKLTLAISVASGVLWALSGRQFGECDDTFHPRPCAHPNRLLTLRTERYTDSWLTAWGCPPGDASGCLPGLWTCGCSSVDVDLPGPVTAVSGVNIDGATLDPSAYRLSKPRTLHRIDGDTWPSAPNPDLDDGVGSFVVMFRVGKVIPSAGVAAAGELACELVKSYTGQTCQLPKRVTQLTRQNVTSVLLDPMDFLTKGRTGLYAVDLFLSAYNPKGLRRRATVHSADDLPLGRLSRL